MGFVKESYAMCRLRKSFCTYLQGAEWEMRHSRGIMANEKRNEQSPGSAVMSRWWATLAGGRESRALQWGHRLWKPHGWGFGLREGSESVCRERGKERWDIWALLPRRYIVQQVYLTTGNTSLYSAVVIKQPFAHAAWPEIKLNGKKKSFLLYNP